MSLVSEFLQYVGLIRNETQEEGNTKKRIADTFETLFNLDIWFKKVAPEHEDASKILRADGILLDPSNLGQKAFHKTFSTFPDNAPDGVIVQLVINDDENVTDDIVTINTNKYQTAGFYEKEGEKWQQLTKTNTASGSYFAPTATGAFT